MAVYVAIIKNYQTPLQQTAPTEGCPTAGNEKLNTNSYNPHRRIIVFGRYPVPGRTKTRLIPLLGPLGAAHVHRRMTEHCLDLLSRCPIGPLTFCYSDGSPQKVTHWLAPYPVTCMPQSKGDLGRRMQTALESALNQAGGPVVLVGTDIPALTADHLVEAFDALAENDLVLGPSTDGGYWLVGCRTPVDIFKDIAWGTAHVLARTLDLAHKQGLSVHLLPALDDIDTPEDWRRHQPSSIGPPKPWLSVIIPTLDEAQHITDAIARVQGPDIEVIVADGGSRDNTAVLARQAGACVVRTPAGRAVQQNTAAAHATGHVLLFLHADTRLPRNFANLIFDGLLDSRVVAGAFKFKTDLDHWAMAVVEQCAHIRSKLFQMPYGDQALFLERRTFQAVGGFPHTPIAEDLMLVRKLSAIGHIRILPAKAVTSARRWRRLGIRPYHHHQLPHRRRLPAQHFPQPAGPIVQKKRELIVASKNRKTPVKIPDRRCGQCPRRHLRSGRLHHHGRRRPRNAAFDHGRHPRDPLRYGTDVSARPGAPALQSAHPSSGVCGPQTPTRPKEDIYPVAAFNSPGYILTHTCAYKERKGADYLPLFSYGAVGWHRGRFQSAVIQVDREPRQDLRLMPLDKIKAGVDRERKAMPGNRLRAHLEKCALTYGCPAGKNFFLERYEAPLPTSTTCNARCLGCISLQPDTGIPSSPKPHRLHPRFPKRSAKWPYPISKKSTTPSSASAKAAKAIRSWPPTPSPGPSA